MIHLYHKRPLLSGNEKKILSYFVLPSKLFYRWVDSHFRANRILFENWKPLVEHLQSIQTDTTFDKDKKGRTKAKQLRQFLLHKNVLSTMALQLDLQGSFKGLSQELQERGGSILGKSKYSTYMVRLAVRHLWQLFASFHTFFTQMAHIS